MPHINEKLDLTVAVFIVHGNKVLLRKHDKYKIWLAVGGHVELDEDPNEAAVREVKEEVGLDIKLVGGPVKEGISDDEFKFKELSAPKFMNIHNITAVHRHLDLVYFATTSTERVVPEKPDDEWKWVTKAGLKEMDLKPNVRFYAEKALEELGI